MLSKMKGHTSKFTRNSMKGLLGNHYTVNYFRITNGTGLENRSL